MGDKPVLCYLVTEDWYFYSHRLPMARAAQRAGFDVVLVTNVDRHRAAIEAEGITVIHYPLHRRSLNPLRAVASIAGLSRIYRRLRPDVVHHIAMKPVLFGSIAAEIAGVRVVLNAFAGLGFLFASNDRLARLMRGVLLPVFRVVLRRPGRWMLLQNPDDRQTLLDRGLVDPARTVIIRGSGVDLDQYRETALPPQDQGFVAAFAGRMIGIKGLQTLREASLILKDELPVFRLWLCGAPDPANPGAWNADELHRWERESGNTVWKGSSDMAAVWPQVHLAIQPSWGGEGIPKSLLEAASCGRPIVASDVPGCREVVAPGENGILVPARDARALADAIIELSRDPARLTAFGKASRSLVERDLSAEAVSSQTEALYRRLKESGR